MSFTDKLAVRALHCLEPERAHGLALKALAAGLAPAPGPITSARLGTRVMGLDFPNPVGVAAGFDKNAEAPDAALAAGFGFVEIGAVTPRPQEGNPRPRLFRLPSDRAVINRMGFNNLGMEAAARNLGRRQPGGIIGVNLGANKDSTDRAADYVTVLTHLYGLAEFFTVNVSSPNTERLRDLQGAEALRALLSGVLDARAGLPGAPKPVLVKIAPDLTDREIADVAKVALDLELDGIVATNTTLAREGLTSRHGGEAGGLSGAPLKDRAQAVITRLAAETGGTIPLIGVGGIATAEDARARLAAGASLVQLYTALVYEGIGLGARIARALDADPPTQP
ncbi:MAG: quinone-dependent dihydroorotate dehydrogenase [Pseudomonadota bacterium]